ncbi:MAG: DUF1295 domain-containing protein [Chitinophagales bacterium]
MTAELYYYILYGWIVMGLVAFPFLLKQTAPYGRHSTTGWGPMISNQLGWVIQEGVAPIFISIWFWMGDLPKTNTSYFFYGIYMAHYIYRSYIFPFRTRTKGKKMPLVICSSAVFFNFCNTFMLGYYLGNVGGNHGNDYFFSPQFIIGLLVFVSGVFINVKSDNMLIALRKPGETGYKIPVGFLFKYISCPNLFGEIIEWIGFAILMWAMPGVSFAVWTFVNLVPRALDHHKWYHQKFADYPNERKAVIPFIL